MSCLRVPWKVVEGKAQDIEVTTAQQLAEQVDNFSLLKPFLGDGPTCDEMNSICGWFKLTLLPAINGLVLGAYQEPVEVLVAKYTSSLSLIRNGCLPGPCQISLAVQWS
jgi:hypothetical protein